MPSEPFFEWMERYVENRLDPAKEYMVGSRPVPIVDRATKPVEELF